ncbi:MAG: helix-turn-helix transcriptional regulator [Oscillospiraceae bacterium]|nr:helix-turn-helix transcriptional regulator [Oscillospiraceae bacterium]MBQ6902534.1 helix-turn-helix transcriptional regulator [Oscillospiraceae bacterium]
MQTIPFYTPTVFLDKIPIRISPYSMRQADSAEHIHRNFQLCFILSGEATNTVNKISYNQSACSCAAFTPYVTHMCDSSKSEETPLLIYISFYDDFLTSRGYDFFPYGREYAHFNGFKIPYFCNFDRHHNEAVHIVREAINEFNKKNKMSYDRIANLIAELLRLICTEPAKDKPSRIFRKAVKNINASVKYIENNFSDKITIEQLCEIAGMSRRSFTKYFKEITGLTVTNFLMSARLNRAANLLAKTDMLHDEVAARTGLGDHSYLAVVFSKYTGITPGEFRKLRYQELNSEAEIPLSKRYEWLNDL